MNNKKRISKFILNVILIIVLTILFLITIYALVKNLMTVDENLFKTGTIKINLNDGQPVIGKTDLLFEQGMTIEREFFIKNESTFDVYYKLYFTDLSGKLADILDVTIKYDDKVLYSGKPNELVKKNVKAADDILMVNEKRMLVITIHYPEDSSNDTQNSDINFKLAVDAIQTKNNPNKNFN